MGGQRGVANSRAQKASALPRHVPQTKRFHLLAFCLKADTDMRTRSDITPAKLDRYTMAIEMQAHHPLQLLMLPKGTSSSARICTLAHPRTEKPSRYYFCPQKGIFEFTRIAAPNSTCHSWLIAPKVHKIQPVNSTLGSGSGKGATLECGHTLPEINGEAIGSKSASEGYVIKAPDFLVATPIDPLFLLLPSLQSKKLFLSVDDILDDLCDSSKHFKQAVTNECTRVALEERMNVVCDVVEGGDEKMYRLNARKLLNELLIKAKAVVALGLPRSMEDKFINKALETPVMGLKQDQSSLSDAAGASQDELSAPAPLPSESTDSQLSVVTSESAASDSSTQTDVTAPHQDPVPVVSDDVEHALRIRTALSYMISVYTPASLAATLIHKLYSEDGPINFKPLDDHLAHVAKVRSEMLASRSPSDFSRKRNMNEDDEAAETRAEKKRKKEEEEKRKKAGESRGIRDLKKADTSGMKKMSDFFGKGVAAKKKR